MGASDRQYETRELSQHTWPDFEKLFSRGHGWDFCWCMAFQRARQVSRKQFRTRAEVSVINHQDKKELVDEGRAHGILVYADGEPIGWCQYGPRDELPIVDLTHSNQQADPGKDTEKVWRITCFVVDRKHRRNGAAGIALRAALDSIRKQGGGLVEAFPVAAWTHGRHASTEAVFVQGVGPVAPAWGGFGNVSTGGTASMFETEGFEAVTVLSSPSKRTRGVGADGYRVLMRKRV